MMSFQNDHTHTQKHKKSTRNLEPVSLFVFFFALARERIFIKTHYIESTLVIGPEHILFACVFACTFQPGNFTGWGGEWVKPDRRWRACSTGEENFEAFLTPCPWVLVANSAVLLTSPFIYSHCLVCSRPGWRLVGRPVTKPSVLDTRQIQDSFVCL